MGPNISSNKTENNLDTSNIKILPQQFKKETVFIFDWDDTLMYTSLYYQKEKPFLKKIKILLIIYQKRLIYF